VAKLQWSQGEQTVLNAGLGGASAHFAVIQKRVFKQNFRTNMLKNVFFFENDSKN